MWQKRVAWALLSVAGIFLLTVTNSLGENAMQLSSSAFQNGGQIPVKYVMQSIGGQNISLPFAWSGAPAGTKSFALSIVDLHPVAHHWVHWMVIDIPPDTRSLAQGASGRDMPSGSVELKNSFGQIGYGGPQPPRGTGEHPYQVTLYALQVAKLDLSPNTGLTAFQQALRGKILAETSITGYYGQ